MSVWPSGRASPACAGSSRWTPDGPTHSAGRLLRIAPDIVLMIMDADDDGFELYRLER
ncbi:MAG: hypothetical protein ACTHL5_08445 [Rhodanobacter sp.]